MLSPPDAELARRDQALPGLGLLLDPEAFVVRLRDALPGLQIGCAQPSYTRYKPGTSCLVGYRMEGDGPVALYAVARRRDDTEKLRKVYSNAVPSSTTGAGTGLLEAESIEVYGFPNDRSLRSLRRIADPTSRSQCLGECFPDQLEPLDGELRTLAYKPERRYVAQLRAKSGKGTVLRLYTDEGFRTARSAAKAFRSSGGVKVPRRLGHSARHRMLLLEWLPGQPLSEVLRDPVQRLSALEKVGAALAELHAQQCPSLPTRSGSWDAASLRTAAAAVAALCPPLEEPTSRLSHTLGSFLESNAAPRCATHGDFYADQVLITPDAVAVLDFDRARLGDPAADLGLFIAHLERNALNGALPSGLLPSMRAALLAGYEVPPESEILHRTKMHTAAGLMMLAVDPFRRRMAEWPKEIERIITRALELTRSQPNVP